VYLQWQCNRTFENFVAVIVKLSNTAMLAKYFYSVVLFLFYSIVLFFIFLPLSSVQ